MEQSKIQKKLFLTTSWDDGDVYDIKLAELLAKYNIKGTFYIPIQNREGRKVVSPTRIKECGEIFEIGSHTYSHSILTRVPLNVADDEIKKGKDALEDILGHRIKAFCFPGGKFDEYHLKLVINSGFLFARTNGYLRTQNIINVKKGLLHTTLQVYRHKPHTYLISCVKKRDLEGIFNIIKNHRSIANWEQFAENIFNKLQIYGGVFHLWGHSWEIEQYNLWDMLENFFRYIDSKRETINFYTNTELWKMMAKRMY